MAWARIGAAGTRRAGTRGPLLGDPTSRPPPRGTRTPGLPGGAGAQLPALPPALLPWRGSRADVGQAQWGLCSPASPHRSCLGSGWGGTVNPPRASAWAQAWCLHTRPHGVSCRRLTALLLPPAGALRSSWGALAHTCTSGCHACTRVSHVPSSSVLCVYPPSTGHNPGIRGSPCPHPQAGAGGAAGVRPPSPRSLPRAQLPAPPLPPLSPAPLAPCTSGGLRTSGSDAIFQGGVQPGTQASCSQSRGGGRSAMTPQNKPRAKRLLLGFIALLVQPYGSPRQQGVLGYSPPTQQQQALGLEATYPSLPPTPL